MRRPTPSSSCSPADATGTRSSSIAVALAGTANVDGLIVSGDRALAHSGGVEWVDPFVGARIRFQPAPGEEVVVRGDIGGFGAGSKVHTWQALATYNWHVCTHGPMLIDGNVGWRALQVDYPQGAGVERYEFDVLQQGPVVGFTGRFETRAHPNRRRSAERRATLGPPLPRART